MESRDAPHPYSVSPSAVAAVLDLDTLTRQALGLLMEDVPTGNAAAATAAAVSEAASRAAQVASREAIDAVYRMWIPNGQNSVECHRVARFAIACGLSVCLSVEKIIHILAAIIVDDSLRVSYTKNVNAVIFERLANLLTGRSKMSEVRAFFAKFVR